MEIAGAAIGAIVGLTFDLIGECCTCLKGTDKCMRNLRNKWEDLERRKLDIDSRMRAQLLPGKRPKPEVEGWLQEVERMNARIQAIERKAREGKFFSCGHVGKLALEQLGEMEELYHGGVFIDSLVVDLWHGELLPTPILIGESTAERVKEKIWACIMDYNCRKIGFYGMGGIGKSTVMKHINNSLINETNKFDCVIWVTVSKPFNVIQLQHDIARKLDLDLEEFKHEKERATKLKAKLEDKKYVLILDDMWEAFPLEEVGIPEPTSSNGCKLVLTSRLFDVCKGFGCMTIKMELLSQQEARMLFMDRLERNVFDTPELKAIAEEVLERCAQLPLAIVTIAASFKLLSHDFEWRDALEDLKTSVKASNNIEVEVFKILRLSYEHLKDGKLQQCLLHCALYPKDFEIKKQELIEHLIDEGIIERRNSRQAEFDRGYSMLNKLENACLLGGIDEEYEKKFVKMHDVVREMVLYVASPQFKVEGHLGLEDFSDEGKWREDLVKASLMYNNISRIPPNVSPMCPKLSTLLLQGNWSLKFVPDSLFEHLHGLNLLDLSNTAIESLPNSVSNLENLIALRLRECRKLTQVPSLVKLTKLRKLDLGKTGIMEVPDSLFKHLHGLNLLDLSNTAIESLPNSVSNLKNLTTLMLRECRKLTQVPSLVKLTKLRKLDLGETGITEVPDGLEMLVNLEYLDLDAEQLKIMPPGILPKLSHLQCLIVFLESVSVTVKGVEVASLKKLEKFRARFRNLSEFNTYINNRSLEKGQILEYDIYVGIPQIRSDEYGGRTVHFSGCGEKSFVVPKDVQYLEILQCKNIRSLCDVPSLNYASELKHIFLISCEGIEYILCCSSSSSCTLRLQTLEFLQLSYLDNLSVLFRKEKDASAQVPPGTFSCLKRIDIWSCSKLKKLLPLGLLIHLYNLEQIDVSSCEQLEEIIEEEKKEEEGMDTTKITLPKLKKLSLKCLLELKSICSSSKVIVFDSLEVIEIHQCPNLKRLPLSLPLLNGQLSPPPSLKQIVTCEEEWWKDLVWDCQVTKNVLQPFLRNPWI